MSASVFVSVIIPVYNQRKLFTSNFLLWKDQVYPRHLYELIVVDDGSTDGLGEDIGMISEKINMPVRYFFQENKGPGAARNLGAHYARGSIIAFSDADCRISPDWIGEIIKGYTNDHVAGIGGTTKAIRTGSIVSQYCDHVRMNEAPVRRSGSIDYIITANASFRKDCFQSIGGFDERYAWAGGEDPDLCYRLRQKGYILKYNRKALVYNPHKQKLLELSKTFFYYGIGEAFLTLRQFSSWDLASPKGMKRACYFLKALLLCLWLFVKSARLFLRFPFQTILYYGEGLNIQRAIAYAFFETIKNISFKYGWITGYIMGKLKGFKRSSIDGFYKENI